MVLWFAVVRFCVLCLCIRVCVAVNAWVDGQLSITTERKSMPQVITQLFISEQFTDYFRHTFCLKFIA